MRIILFGGHNVEFCEVLFFECNNIWFRILRILLFGSHNVKCYMLGIIFLGVLDGGGVIMYNAQLFKVLFPFCYVIY